MNKERGLVDCFNLAWQSDRGGYELRGTGDFKRCLGPKDITTITCGSKDLNLFECFFNYLSALSYFNLTKFKNTTIVLNSVTNISKITYLIPTYQTVNSFLDNDEISKKAFQKLSDRFGNLVNMSERYFPAVKDFNVFINQNQHATN